MIFKGSGVAIITPFNKDNSINYTKLEELIEFHIANSTDAIIVCGTTGESATLSENEKKELIKFTIQKTNKRIPVIAGTGSNCTSHAIELSRFADNLGADGLLIVTPYYNKCTQEGLIEHYKQIASNIATPIIIYNVPSRTGLNIEVDTLEKLAKVKNIVGIKEASGNISQVAKISATLKDGLDIYSGNDDQTLPILSLGGKGVISTAANIIPEQMHNLCKHYFDGDIDTAKKIQLKYLELMNALFIEVNPIPIKEAMNILKFNVGNTRLPLTNMTKKDITKLKESINKVSFKSKFRF